MGEVMNDKFNYFIDTFRGIGLGLNFGLYDHYLIVMGTFLCFNFYMEFRVKKI
jgi:hypothetical protein